MLKLISKIKYRISFLGFRDILVRLVREKTHSKLCTRKDKSLGVFIVLLRLFIFSRECYIKLKEGGIFHLQFLY